MAPILLSNAYEAWFSAITSCDKILRGFSSLQYQKNFVSSLHNAVELFLKQLMINSGDKTVAEVTKKAKKTNPTLESKYQNATDLNRFFSTILADERSSFHSIGFSELIGKCGQLLKINNGIFQKELELLQKLRNTETHFCISEDDYLSENDFVVLHNFMCQFFDILVSNGLFPGTMTNFNGKYELCAEKSMMNFDWQPLKTFSYKDALSKNELSKKIVEILQGNDVSEYACCAVRSDWDLAKCIVRNNQQFKDSIGEIFTIVRLMSKYQIFKVHTEYKDVELDDIQTVCVEENYFTFGC